MSGGLTMASRVDGFRAAASVLMAVTLLVAAVVVVAPGVDAVGETTGTTLSRLGWQNAGGSGVGFGIEMDPETGLLHVTNTTSEAIDIRDPFGKYIETYGEAMIDGVTLDYPSDVAFMGDSIYVAYFNSGHVVQYNRTTKAMVNWFHAATDFDPVGIDAADGQVYVANRGSSEIRVFNATLSESRTTTMQLSGGGCIVYPNDVAVDGGRMYVVAIAASVLPGACGLGIWILPSAAPSSVTGTPAVPLATGYALAAADSGQLFATSGSRVEVYNPSSFDPNIVPAGLLYANDVNMDGSSTGLTVDPSGNSVWAMNRSNGRFLIATYELCQGQPPSSFLGSVGDDTVDLSSPGPRSAVWTGAGDDNVIGAGPDDIVCTDEPCRTVGLVPIRSTAVITPAECAALAALERAGLPLSGLDIDQRNAPSDPCEWLAIRCLTVDGTFAIAEINVLAAPINPDVISGPLPAEIGAFSHLGSLILDGQQVTSLPPEIGHLSRLKSLSMSGNGLTSLPPEIGQLSLLAYLDVHSNSLTSLPPEVGQLSQLGFLHLGENPISELPPEIGQLANLSRLSANQLLLTSVPSAVTQLTSLEFLELSGNQLQSLPEGLSQLRELKRLFASQNELTELPADIGDFPALEFLHLGENHLAGLLPTGLTSQTIDASLLLGGNGCLTADAVLKAHLIATNNASSLEQGCAADIDFASLDAPNSVLIDVVANDGVPRRAIESITVITPPAQGVLTQEGDKLRYTPAVSTSIRDEFTYEICSGTYCDQAEVGLSIKVPTCLGQIPTMWGTHGDDAIVGTSGYDVIITFGGDDLIEGNGGPDWICGGAGNDEIIGGDTIDTIDGGPGNDLIHGGLGIDRIWARAGDDTIYGEGGSDRIRAGSGNDTVYAGSGADRVWGGAGNDMLIGMGGQDRMWGQAGNDELLGNFQSDWLYGGTGRDILRGAGGKDKLFGEGGDDELYGGNNTDYLHGGVGNDLAHGQRGKDNPLVTNVSGCVAETKISC